MFRKNMLLNCVPLPFDQKVLPKMLQKQIVTQLGFHAVIDFQKICTDCDQNGLEIYFDREWTLPPVDKFHVLLKLT